LIIGNNFNKNNEKPTSKFPGAFVADPIKVSNVSKMQINGRFINCFNNLLDSDYTALYPSIIRQYNIAANTQVGKVIIDEHIHNKENRRHDENWDRAGSFFEDFHTQNWIIVGAKWFNLPGVEALYDYVYNYFNTRVMPTNMYGFKPIDVRREYYQPIRFLEEGYSPIIFHPVMNTVKVGEWRNYVEQHPNQQF
jgi:phosphomevalonate kinase